MRMLYLTINFPASESTGNLYSDLVAEFTRHGHQVHVVTLEEMREGGQTRVAQEGACTVLRVRSANVFKVGMLQKGVGLLILPWLFRRAMAKHLPATGYDLILYATPPVTFAGIVAAVKRKYKKATTYLMLKDIFPQNAKDLGIIRNSIIFKYFRQMERLLYSVSDFIGCMSSAGKDFLLSNNPEILASRVEVLPNTCTPAPDGERSAQRPRLTGLGVPPKKVVILWGGNMGKPQGMPYVLQIIEANRDRADRHFLLVGDGTERAGFAQALEARGLSNATLLRALPRAEYSALARECDIGLITLDPRFTIPNFPSRVLGYLEQRLPILAAVNGATDLGLMLQRARAGLWAPVDNMASLQVQLDRLAADRDLRIQMGANGRRYLEANFTSNHAYQIIAKHLADNSNQGEELCPTN